MSDSGSGVALTAGLNAIMQNDLLIREFEDALFPEQKFRGEALPELWEANIGQTLIESRMGIMTPDTRPKQIGQDPTPRSRPNVEHWKVVAQPYSETLDTHMPTSYVALAELVLKDAQNLGMLAGQTFDHIVRNKIYGAYVSGNTYTDVGANNSVALHVANLKGFNYTLDSNGMPTAVSSANPLKVGVNVGLSTGTVQNIVTNNTVIGTSPDDNTNPDGPGYLTLGTAVTVSAGASVIAGNAPFIVRVGGASTTNGIASSNQFTLDTLLTAVTRMKNNYIPRYPDGLYHCHLDPTSIQQIFRDSAFQLLFRGTEVSSVEFANGVLSRLYGVKLIENTECPQPLTISTYDNISADVIVPIGVNEGTEIHRPIVLGYPAIYEKYLDEERFITEAGVLGKIGSFHVTANGGYQVVTDRVRYIMRAPMDRLQETIGQTFSFKGDWGIPSDSVTGDAALYKRCVVIEHGA